MIGIAKIKRNEIIAKCGFKYLRFGPTDINIISDELISYKNINYNISGRVFYFKFFENDIYKEKMMSLVINNCIILNCMATCNDSAVTNLNQTDIYPVIEFKKINTSYYVFNQYDFIRKDFEENIIDSSVPSLIGQKAKILYSYEKNKIDPLKENSNHFIRFCGKYSDPLKLFDIDLEKYESYDVIDLENVQDVIFNMPKNLSTYKVLNFHNESISSPNIIFEKEELEKLDDSIFYYLLIDDSISHALLFKDNQITLHVTIMPKKKSKRLLILKFNKKQAKKFLIKQVIYKLSHST